MTIESDDQHLTSEISIQMVIFWQWNWRWITMAFQTT